MKDERGWGTAGWLDDHELKGDGRTVRCQRKTKTYDQVAAATRQHGAIVCIKAVYRKTFVDGDELCAAFLYGLASRNAVVPSSNALSRVTRVADDLVVDGTVFAPSEADIVAGTFAKRTLRLSNGAKLHIGAAKFMRVEDVYVDGVRQEASSVYTAANAEWITSASLGRVGMRAGTIFIFR